MGGSVAMPASRRCRDVWYDQKLRTPVPLLSWSMVARNRESGRKRARRKDSGVGIKARFHRGPVAKAQLAAAAAGARNSIWGPISPRPRPRRPLEADFETPTLTFRARWASSAACTRPRPWIPGLLRKQVNGYQMLSHQNGTRQSTTSITCAS